MSRAQQLRRKRELKGDNIPDYETYDFSLMTEKDNKKACMLLKFGRKGHAHETIVRLSDDKLFIQWDGRFWSRKKPEDRRVALEQVDRVQDGQKTPPFERLKKHFGEAEKNSFSLIYGNNRSLDFIAPTPEMFQIWYYGLQSILKHIADRNANMDMDRRFLKEKFDSADKHKLGTITRKDAQALLASMNIPIPAKTIHETFKDLNRDKSGKMTFDEFTEFMNRLRRRPEMEILWDIITNDKSSDRRSDLAKVQPFSNLGLKDGLEYDFLNGIYPVQLDLLIKYWAALQGEVLEQDIARKMVRRVTPKIFFGNEPVLSYVGWISLITQPENDAYDPEKRKYKPETLQRPFSHYFIASSHNTYLTGDQLQSQSSVNRYIDDLCKNCRCVEIDCWDGETEDKEPIVTHGGTLTSKIKFEDVIVAIKNYAFKNSPYPLTLSIENHCSFEQQEKMAQIFIFEFGNMLLTQNEFNYDNLEAGQTGELPSPEQLKKKIMIKGKVCKKGDLEDEDEDTDDDPEADDASSSIDGSSHGSKSSRSLSSSSMGLSSHSLDSSQSSHSLDTSQSLRSFKSMPSTSSMQSDDDDSRSEMSEDTRSESESDFSRHLTSKPSLHSVRDSIRKNRGQKMSARQLSRGLSSSSGSTFSLTSSGSYADLGSEYAKEHKKKGTHPALSAITFLGTMKHKNFNDSKTTACNMMSSFSEGKTLKYLTKPKTVKEWIAHNAVHISRVYPKGTRVDSSNLDPTHPWAAGNQMVALNYQTPSEQMQINDGMFLQNGGCGYVLKPEYMYDLTKEPTEPYLLTVHVISGQQIPKANTKTVNDVEPYVQVSIHGVSADTKNHIQKTVTLKNSFNPVWDQVFEFKIRQPDVAHLLFRVYDEDSTKKTSEFIAYSSIPLSCLREGLRSVTLYDEKGEKKGDFAFASLVIRTKVSEWVNAEAEILEEEKKHRHKVKDEGDKKKRREGGKKGMSSSSFGSMGSSSMDLSSSSSDFSSATGASTMKLDNAEGSALDNDDTSIGTSAHVKGVSVLDNSDVTVMSDQPMRMRRLGGAPLQPSESQPMRRLGGAPLQR